MQVMDIRQQTAEYYDSMGIDDPSYLRALQYEYDLVGDLQNVSHFSFLI